MNNPTRSLRLNDKQFLWRLILAGFLLRLAIVIALQLSDAIFILRLSPDSERYHRAGIVIAAKMAEGDFNWPRWFDDGWFQFTGFIYWLIGPYDWLIQLINITLSCVSVIPLYRAFQYMVDDIRIQRFYAIIFMFFPSVVYWSVLMLKDAAGLLAIALIVYSLVRLRIAFGWRLILLYVAGMVMLLGVRAYLFFVIMLVTAPALLLFPYRPHLSVVRTLGLSLAAGLFPMLLGYGFFGINYIEQSRYFDVDYVNHIRVAMGDHGSGAIFGADDVHVWGESIIGDIGAILRTLLAVFIPVNPFDVGSTRQLLALPFTLVMIVLMYPMVAGIKHAWHVRKLSTPVLVIGGAVLAVYVSGTTNIGALFRWTTQIMPYFLMAIAVGFFYRERTFTSRLGTRLVRSWI